MRKPGMVRRTDYTSRSSIVEKSHRDPRALRFVDRITPEDRRNFLITKIQTLESPPCAWETVMTLGYEDSDITEVYSKYIGARC